MAREKRYQYKESSQAAVLCLALFARGRGECACFVVFLCDGGSDAMQCGADVAVVSMMSVVVDFEREPRCRTSTGDPAFSRGEGRPRWHYSFFSSLYSFVCCR